MIFLYFYHVYCLITFIKLHINGASVYLYAVILLYKYTTDCLCTDTLSIPVKSPRKRVIDQIFLSDQEEESLSKRRNCFRGMSLASLSIDSIDTSKVSSLLDTSCFINKMNNSLRLNDSNGSKASNNGSNCSPIKTKKGVRVPLLVFSKASGVPEQLIWEGQLTPRLDDKADNPCKIQAVQAKKAPYVRAPGMRLRLWRRVFKRSRSKSVPKSRVPSLKPIKSNIGDIGSVDDFDIKITVLDEASCMNSRAARALKRSKRLSKTLVGSKPVGFTVKSLRKPSGRSLHTSAGRPLTNSGPGRSLHNSGSGRPLTNSGPGRPLTNSGPGRSLHNSGPGRPLHNSGPGRPLHNSGLGRPITNSGKSRALPRKKSSRSNNLFKPMAEAHQNMQRSKSQARLGAIGRASPSKRGRFPVIGQVFTRLRNTGSSILSGLSSLPSPRFLRKRKSTKDMHALQTAAAFPVTEQVLLPSNTCPAPNRIKKTVSFSAPAISPRSVTAAPAEDTVEKGLVMFRVQQYQDHENPMRTPPTSPAATRKKFASLADAHAALSTGGLASASTEHIKPTSPRPASITRRHPESTSLSTPPRLPRPPMVRPPPLNLSSSPTSIAHKLPSPVTPLSLKPASPPVPNVSSLIRMYERGNNAGGSTV